MYNVKGVKVAKVCYRHTCNYEGCRRAAFYKFTTQSVIGKALRDSVRTKKKDDWKTKQTGKPVYYDHVPYGTGYFCSFDCLRKHLLVKAFEAKIKLTPLVKDFLGQGEVPITDHEIIIEDYADLHIPGNNRLRGDINDYIKISPNGIKSHPFQIDLAHQSRNLPIGLSLEGAKKFISALQTLIDERDKIGIEQAHMTRRKKLDKNK